MEEREKIIELYNIYHKLLSETEIKYFEYYYFEDYSLFEISEIFGVSKSYTGKVINKIVSKLNNYEDALSINYKNIKLREIMNLITENDIKEKIEKLL